MGTWSHHPMGNDKALDMRDDLIAQLLSDVGGWDAVRKLPDDEGEEVIRKALTDLTPEKFASAYSQCQKDPDFDGSVIAYAYVTYQCAPADESTRGLVKYMLSGAVTTMKSTLKDAKDASKEDRQFIRDLLKYLQDFEAHFDEALAGEYDVMAL